MKKTWKVAVIGCGNFAQNQYLPHIELEADAKCVAVVDIVPERAKSYAERFNVPNWYSSVDELLEKCDFDAVDGKIYEDSIGDCGDFRTKNIGKHYQIPYGALYNPEFDNILACGRIISAPQGDGWEVARVIPICALTGEAAGKAAAKAVEDNIQVSKVNAKELF